MRYVVERDIFGLGWVVVDLATDKVMAHTRTKAQAERKAALLRVDRHEARPRVLARHD